MDTVLNGGAGAGDIYYGNGLTLLYGSLCVRC